jgi:mono/diheme cytochrome c family protein
MPLPQALRSLALLLSGLALAAAPPGKDPLKDVPAFSGSPQKYWTDVCARCHGATGSGRDLADRQLPDAGFDFTDSRKANRRKDEDWVRLTLAGKEKMPAFKGRMTEDDVRAMLPLMRSFSAKR